VSRESEEIFSGHLDNYVDGDDPGKLRAAAAGHLGASRSLEELTAEYAAALDSGHHEAAQRIADELAPIRTAARVAAGGLPRTGG
jgi:hypothetical protein